MSLSQILGINAALILIAMTLLWLASLRLRNASIVDVFWGLGFVLIAWTTWLFTQSTVRSVLLVVLTTLWGLRLSAYIAWRNHGKGEDPRYKEMRDHRGDSFWWISLFTVFLLQGAIMWLISLPIQGGQTENSSLSVFNYAGVVVWGIGFLFESIGDYQLARFKADPGNEGQVMDQGLWRYSRHPNYFGNAMIWWGLFFVAVTLPSVWLAVSPLVMTFLLLKVSGVSLLERSMKSRSAEYRRYVERTSAFVPWPPKVVKADQHRGG